ncbi:MAG TPA: nucleotidyltransferase family protein, partial [Pyrinomonadaceae bacterium]|nr:nucleotidyltransferase family protein [Pyrinomonadaceae bacterium]
VGDEEIRVLSPEDNLALLAIHLLKHGVWRAVWLCDIGAAIESLPREFDWKICLGPNRTRANWIVSAIMLANHLLGAKIEGLPITRNASQPPDWLVDSVLAQWSNPFSANQAPTMHPIPFAQQLRRPSGLLSGLRKRWPNPVIATVSVNGRFNNLPRMPYQLGNCVLRAAEFVTRPIRISSTSRS